MLKQGETFAVFDRYGNIQRVGLGEQGLYHQGTRFLSRLEFRLAGRRPLLLSSTIKEDNATLNVDLTNPDFSDNGQVVLPRDMIHMFRRAFLWHGALYDRLRLRNYSLQPVDISFEYIFGADFADIFEVRGAKRQRRGQALDPIVEPGRVQISYRGLDEQDRRTVISFDPLPAELDGSAARFHVTIPAHGERTFDITIGCQPRTEAPKMAAYDDAAHAMSDELRLLREGEATLGTSNEQCNDWINRSVVDLYLMVTRTGHGLYPYAGVPWFSTVFGRDGILTALQYLWINPRLARGVLSYLAANQATETNSIQDAEPGKILHETRHGEMAALGEIPFGRYYGSVDSTPLFVMLAGAYYERTADLEFIKSIWPNIEAALDWIECYGDPDEDGFVEYCRRSPKGLVVQGWKDSVDSVFHADGSLAEGPVALVEVQGYVYAALRAAAELAAVLDLPKRSTRLNRQADDLRAKFEEHFWCEELGTYALALDGKKQPCKVRTSNPGHCLAAGIVSPQRAARVAATLVDGHSFSGWGIRTVSDEELRYNPMSYHNGSVWPHDNAIIAAGMARYGLSEHVAEVFTGLFDTSLFVEISRMPELFCGFPRRAGEGPTLYPVACAPQSWAAAAVFSLIQSLLGLSIDAPRRQIRFVKASLPESLMRIDIRNLQVADATVDLAVERFPSNVGVEVKRRHGSVDIISIK